MALLTQFLIGYNDSIIEEPSILDSLDLNRVYSFCDRSELGVFIEFDSTLLTLPLAITHGKMLNV